MLACVCQPADSAALFSRRSPIPLGAPPLRLRPGRPRRSTAVITEQPPSDSESHHRRHAVGGGCVRRSGKATPASSSTTSSSSSSASSEVGSDGAAAAGGPRGPVVVDAALAAEAASVSLAVVTKATASVAEASAASSSAAALTTDTNLQDIASVKLPDGVQLTLSELREMACRQQQQIESQHALLAAKEQRLRYLKEQEARQQRVAAESERLRRLRERVDAQELKLRKLRALRGQVDQHKQNNVSLTSDLDSIRALFNEKEKELSLAVAKVEELTRQLEELRRGRPTRDQPPPASALELDKLRRELMYRNKLNEQQNARLSQQREALTARQEEMSSIDKRICELQERLHRKRVLNQQLANQISAASHKAAYQQLVRLTSGSEQHSHGYPRKPSQPSNQQHNGLSRGNIAAVEPYNHVPNAHHVRSSVGAPLENPPTYHPVYQQNHIKDDLEHQANDHTQDSVKKISNLYAPRIPDDPKDCLNEFTVSKSDPKYQTLPYNTKFTVNLISTGMNNNNKIQHDQDNNIDTYSKEVDPQQLNVATNSTTSSPHMTVHSAPLSTVNKSLATPLSQNDLLSNRKNLKEATNTNGNSGYTPPNNFSSKGPTLDGRNLHVQQQHQNGSSKTVPSANDTPSSSSSSSQNTPTYYQKPISSVAPTSVHHSGKLSAIYQTSSIKVQPVEPQTIGANNGRQMSPVVQSPSSLVLSPPQSTSTPVGTPEIIGCADKSPRPALPPKPAIKPPPRQTQLATPEKEPSPPPVPQTEPPDDSKPTTPLSSHPAADNLPIIKAKPLTIKKQPLSEQPKLRNLNSYSKLNGVILSSNRRIEMPPAFHFPEMEIPPADLINETKTNEQQQQQQQQTSATSNGKPVPFNNANVGKGLDQPDRASPNVDDHVINMEGFQDDKLKNTEQQVNLYNADNVVRRGRKGNLKQTGKANLSRRVSFDPLALLLDASLEGELELVKKTASQVTNPSAANDEGITALHNAICAGHLEIVKFLVEFGCDVNAQDSDGWTPLHCAASCNNVAMVRFLVEHGACIFATTLSDHETAAEKCEEDEEGFDGCSEYLYSVQEKLGILSGGVVYAVFDYIAQQPDELSFSAGQQLTVLRKGDEHEREWWWSRLGDTEGYVPRNLLGLYPRVSNNED